MKKRVILVAVVLMLCMVGCNNETKPNTEETVQESFTQSGTEQENMDTIVPETEAEVSNENEIQGPNSSSRISYAGTDYSWQEISMIIPEEWQDKYFIKEFETGFSIIQKASNEKNEDMGFLCGITRSDAYSGDFPGSSLIGFSDDGMFYYLTFPTDVTFFADDEAISAEYMAMSEQLEWVAGSVTINKENIHYDANQYILVNSNISPLEDYQLMNLSDNQLWIARNEIYARHGRIFKNAYLNSYFNSCSWYHPEEGKTEVADSELSQIEKDNLQRILAAEQAYKEAHPYPQQYKTNTEISIPLTGATGMNKDYKVSYITSVDEAWNYTSILKINGETYDLFEYVPLQDPAQDVFYITDLAEDNYYPNDGLEIAILDNGPSDDPITYFFKYDEELVYVGYIPGFPFKDYGNGITNKDQATGLNGFTYQNGVFGTVTTDLIETAYIEKYYWYNSSDWMFKEMDLGLYTYKWNEVHELYVELPVYFSMDENSPTIIMKPQDEVYFIKTDNKEWIFIRSKDGVEGYIHVKDGKILNVNLPAEEVLSNLRFFG